jgi:hypothetical protein
MHSWRVLILPYMEELVLFQKYNLNEPWDGPNNRKLSARIPELYRCPNQHDGSNANALETNYFVVVGPETMYPGGGSGRSIRNVKDGTARRTAKSFY